MVNKYLYLQAVFIKLIFFALLLIVSTAYYIQITKEKDNFLYTDFGKFYVSAQLLLQGHNAYAQLILDNKDNPPAKHLEKAAGNLNPPFFTLLALPFGSMNFSHALWFWSLLSITCAALSIYQLQCILKLSPYFSSYFLLLLALLIYFPTFTNIVFGQVVLILLPLIIGAWQAAKNNKTVALGILLGTAASLKIFLGLFFIYFIVRREWRALRWFSLSFLTLSLLPMVIWGKNIYLQYYHIMSHIWWYSSSWNASLYGYLARLFGIGEENIPLIAIPGLAKILYWLFATLFIFYLVHFLQPVKKIPPAQKTDLDFSIILIGMLLLSPLGWSYYFPFLIVPIIVIMQNISAHKHHMILLSLLCFAVILTSNPHTFEGPKDIKNITDILGWSGYYSYGLILLLCLLSYLRKQLASNQQIISSKPTQLTLTFCIIMLTPSLLGILKSSNTVTNNQFIKPHISVVKIKDG